MQKGNTKQVNSIINRAINTIRITAQSLTQLSKQLPVDYTKIVQLLYDCSGRIIVTGIGKSALIAQKISATFNSTGTVSAYMHAGDALHGDLGMVQKKDIILALSKSGNTPEIVELCKYAKKQNIKTVLLVSNLNAQLLKLVDFFIQLPLEREADPNNLAPTTSSCLQLVIGDALALCLAEIRGFKQNDFGRFHPAGTLGKLLHTSLNDILSQNEKPSVLITDKLSEIILEISKKRMGATAVVNSKKELKGIITDGDLRRMLEQEIDYKNITAEHLMCNNPTTVSNTTTAYEALQIMELNNISQLIITNSKNSANYLGMIHLHDII
ncbi:UNVERIFIED_CONTAM: hypothetical protein GTU68_066767 [Idotea baltica]|nr:hypothetical protein [Idotea baltica]